MSKKKKWSKAYAAKLRDPRWQKRRLEVFEAAKFTCEDCGRTDLELQVHHCIYVNGKEPWEYTLETLRCVCCECHPKRQEIEGDLKILWAQLCRRTTPAGLRDLYAELESRIAAAGGAIAPPTPKVETPPREPVYPEPGSIGPDGKKVSPFAGMRRAIEGAQ